MTRTRLLIISLLTLAGAAIAVPSINAAPTCTIGWTGGAGSSAWSNAGNWNQNRLPGGSDDVCIDVAGGGTVVFAGISADVRSIQGAQALRIEGGTLNVTTLTDATIASLEQTGGTLGGAGRVTVAGGFDWSGGLHSGSGMLDVKGSTHIHGNVQMPFDRELKTNGGSWTSGQIYGRNNTYIRNTGTFSVSSEAGTMSFDNYSGTPATFINEGTLVKSAGTGTTEIGWRIDNDGMVSATSGTLRFSGGAAGGDATGHFQSPGAALQFAGGTFLMSAGTYDGVELVSPGRIEVPVGLVWSGTDLTMTSGSIGGQGTVESTGTFNWNGGSMDDTGLTRSTGFTSIDGNVTIAFNRRLQTKDGQWLSGQIYSRNGTVWTNTGLFEMRAPSGTGIAEWDNYSGAPPKLLNQGTITRTAGPDTTTRVDWAIENDGVIRTDVGRLLFGGGGGVSNGNFASDGDGRTVLGASRYGNNFVLGTSETAYDGFEIAGGTVVVQAGQTFTGLDLWQTGGVIAGTGTLETTGTFTWTGGSMDDVGLTRSTGFTRIDGHVAFPFNRKLQTHDGEWLSGNIHSRNSTLWTNTGTFDMRSEAGYADWDNYSGAQPKIHNTGTILKTSTAASETTDDTIVEFAIENDGVIRTSAGRLRFNGGGGQSNGDFASEGDGRTVLGGGDFFLGDSTTPFDGFEVAGTAEVDVVLGATFTGKDLWQSGGTIGGPGTLASSGTFTWTGGNMHESGLTKSTGFTRIAGNVSMSFDRKLQTHDGEWTAGKIYSRNNTLWTNTGTFDLRSEGANEYADWDNYSGAQPRIVNTGTFTKTAGAANTLLEFALENDGTIRTDAGRLSFTGGGGVSNGSFASEHEGRTVLAGGHFTLGDSTMPFDGFEVAGTAQVDVTSDATFTGKDLWQSGGTIGGPGTLATSGTFLWTGGNMNGTGTTRSTGFTRINGNVAFDFNRTLETKDGEWLDGKIYSRNNTTWRNKGTFDLRAEGANVYGDWDNYSGQQPKIVNEGTFTKTAGVGNTFLEFALENDGTIRTDSGRLSFTGGGTGESTGSLASEGTGRTVLQSGTFTFGSGTFDGFEVAATARMNLAAGATYAGLDLWQTGGTIGGPGTISSSGTFTWSGGAMDGAGVTRSTGFTRIAGDVGLEFDRTLETKDGEWLTGTVRSRNNTLWRNTGNFVMGSPGDIVHDNYSGGPPRLHNTGQITRPLPAPDAVAEDLHVGFPVDNDGSITSDWGTIRLNGGGYDVSTGVFGARLAGNWTFGPGATFVAGGEYAGGTLTLQDGADIELPGGRLTSGTITGNGDIRVPSGELVWAGGEIRGAGVLHVGTAAKLTLTGDHFRYLSGRRLLQNEGTLRWENGYVQVRDNATLLNEGRLEAVAELARYIHATGLTQSGRSSFVNTGTIVKSAGTGNANLTRLENEGLIDVRSGTLESPYFRGLAGGRIVATISETGHGRFIASSDVRLAGKVAVRLADGFTPPNGATYAVVGTTYAQPQNGALTPETLSFGESGTLTGELINNEYVFTANVQKAAPSRAATEPVAASPAPAAPEPTAEAEAQATAGDSVVRLSPGREAVVAVPQGATVELITRTKRAKVRFDRKARKLRVKLRRGARGKRLKLRYRVVTADGTRSKITTLTVRISRSAKRR